MTDTETVRRAPKKAPAKNTRNKKKKKKTPKQEMREWIITIAIALAIALLVRTFLFEPVVVDGQSMHSTLRHGEIMLVTKPDYLLGEPERFDVVICHYPQRGNTNFVKRIVGLPGDTVEINDDGYLIVNGQLYEEAYITAANRGRSMNAYTVPEGMYFVMGDNRGNSNDSRNLRDVGPITRDMIVGHVQCVIFPFDAWRAIE